MAFSFPASPATNDTYTVGSRTYTWTGYFWEMTGGLITTSQLTDLGVTTAKINDLAVTTGKVNDLAVTAGKIANATITATQIASNAVTTAKILDANVTAGKLANTAVTAGSYTASSITVDAQGRLTAASSGTAAVTPGLVFISSQTATAASSLSFNNCFSSTYRDYFINISMTAGTVTGMRLRSAGTDETQSYYVTEGIIAYTTNMLNDSYTSFNRFELDSYFGYSPHRFRVEMGDPFNTRETSFGCDQWYVAGSPYKFSQKMGRLNISSSYDGFTIYGSTLDLSVQVYGYRLT